MKLMKLVSDLLNESEGNVQEQRSQLWDQVISVVNEGDPLFPIIEFLALVYNGGLAGTVLEMGDRVNPEDVIQALEGISSYGVPSNANYLQGNLDELIGESQFQEFKRNWEEAMNNARHGGDEEMNGDDIMDGMAKLCDPLENWIYDDANIVPILQDVLKAGLLNESESNSHTEVRERTELLGLLWDQATSVVKDGDPLFPIVDFLALVYNGGLAEVFMDYTAGVHEISPKAVIQALEGITSSGNQVVYLHKGLKRLIGGSKFNKFKQDWKEALNNDGRDHGDDFGDDIRSGMVALCNPLERWIYDDANIVPILQDVLNAKMTWTMRKA